MKYVKMFCLLVTIVFVIVYGIGFLATGKIAVVDWPLATRATISILATIGTFLCPLMTSELVND